MFLDQSTKGTCDLLVEVVAESSSVSQSAMRGKQTHLSIHIHFMLHAVNLGNLAAYILKSVNVGAKLTVDTPIPIYTFQVNVSTMATTFSGSIGCVSLNTMSFLRLVCCAYFRKQTPVFQLQMPEALFHSIPATHGALYTHFKWLGKIRSIVHQRLDQESNSMPSTEAQVLHWKRCIWVLEIWNCATKNISLPAISISTYT